MNIFLLIKAPQQYLEKTWLVYIVTLFYGDTVQNLCIVMSDRSSYILLRLLYAILHYFTLLGFFPPICMQA